MYFFKTLNIFIALSNLIRGHNTQFFHIESVALQRDIVLYSIYQIILVLFQYGFSCGR